MKAEGKILKAMIGMGVVVGMVIFISTTTIEKIRIEAISDSLKIEIYCNRVALEYAGAAVDSLLLGSEPPHLESIKYNIMEKLTK